LDVVLQSRPPEYGPGRFHPKAASGQGCITVLLLGPVEIGGITGRHAIRSNRRVCIWVSIFIDAACLFWAHVGFQTQCSRLRGQPGQQVHRVQTSESSPMLGGDQAHRSGSDAEWNSLLPGDARQRP
jgi:hypothetical protein